MRITKGEDGLYHVGNKSFKYLVGERQQVGHGTAYKTTYGKDALTQKDLIQNKWGRWVSKKKHFTAKKEKRLEKAGYFAKKGSFGYVKRSKTLKKRKSCKN